MTDFTILSIDLGSTFGYALGKNGVIVESGEVTLSAAHAHPGHRWLKFGEWLHRFRDVNEILVEDVPGFKSSDAAKVHGALLGKVQEFSLVHGIRMGALTPGQIKGDFTGNGNAKKEVMCDVAINLGWRNGVRGTRQNNNECDAIALLWCVYKRRCVVPSFKVDLTNSQQGSMS